MSGRCGGRVGAHCSPTAMARTTAARRLADPVPFASATSPRCPRSIHAVRVLTAAIAALAVLGCPAGERDRRSARNASASAAVDSVAHAAPSPWYRRARALDLTGDGRVDSVRLDAVGTRPDSLRITLALIVDGAVKHREDWGSSYELALTDSSLHGGPQIDAVLRAQLDSVLSSVLLQRFDKAFRKA